MRIALELNRRELERLQYPIIVEMWEHKARTGRIKRAYLAAFDEKERKQLGTLHTLFHRWHLVTGTPDTHTFLPSTLGLIERAVNFFATV